MEGVVALERLQLTVILEMISNQLCVLNHQEEEEEDENLHFSHSGYIYSKHRVNKALTGYIIDF